MDGVLTPRLVWSCHAWCCIYTALYNLLLSIWVPPIGILGSPCLQIHSQLDGVEQCVSALSDAAAVIVGLWGISCFFLLSSPKGALGESSS